jgi:hypothetical protein
MVEICQGLFVGTEHDYEARVRGKTGWRVVHACKEPYHRQLLGYKGRGAPKNDPEYFFAVRGDRLFLNLIDTEDPSYVPKQIIDKALEFIYEALKSGECVLVHCNEGESRAPVVGLLYMAAKTDAFLGLAATEAEKRFKTLYPAYAPKRGMRGFLYTHWKKYATTTGSAQ